MKKILTIAGSDCSGGAGIQADIKTITVHNMYAMSVITALTAQNTTGVYGVLEASHDFVAQQLDCVFQDIRPDAVKIGMVSNAEIIKVIADKLIEYKAENIVVDPVMVATSGGKLMQDDASATLTERLLPLAAVITPNIPESEALAGISVASHEEMRKAAQIISEKMTKNRIAAGLSAAEMDGQPGVCGAILIKGGHFEDSADDLIYIPAEEKEIWLNSEHIENENTHGTGCTLSSAIACNLAAGFSVEDSVRNAKAYITGAIADGLNLGNGNGPLNHMYRMK